jgi:hypothetical protein
MFFGINALKVNGSKSDVSVMWKLRALVCLTICQTCNKAVTWRQRAVACDNCNLWYHANCMGMNSAIYKALEPSNASWTCCQCGIPNFSTSLFESCLGN